jgi:hypothetical protein
MELYRVWRWDGTHTTSYPVKDPQEAARTIVALIHKDQKDPCISANCFGLEWQNLQEEWEEWYDANGDDINAQVDILLGD